MFVMLSRLFIAALCSPDLLAFFVMSILILLLSHLGSWDRCGTRLYGFLILFVFLTLKIHVFENIMVKRAFASNGANALFSIMFSKMFKIVLNFFLIFFNVV